MRAYGVCCTVAAWCILSSGCGSSDSGPKKPVANGDGGQGGAPPDDAKGESGKGGKPPGGAGTSQATAGMQQTTGGASEAGAVGTADDGGAAGTASLQFAVVGDEGVHPISPRIYGANLDAIDCANSKARFTFCRSRSASWSTYNWENNASNAGQSDCNENNDALSSSSTPGAAVTDVIDIADAIGAATVVTVPMLDHAARDKDGGSAAPACSGDVSKTGGYLDTRFVKNRPRKGSALSLAPDTSDAYVNQDEFVAFLKAGYSTSKLLFSLDNQPELWSSEHPTVRQTPLTYDEEVSLSVDYAKMIKDTWPGAEVVSFVGYGYLAATSQQGSPEYASLGEFYSYFLKKTAVASAADHRRLVDYVDLHWFAELYANGHRIIEEDASPASVAARVQAPRSLWDPTFIEDSWITGVNGGKPIELLTWLEGAVAANYPGTKLAISEWSYGGGKHISGAIAAADALGIFGQRGTDLAGVVSFSPDDEPYLIGAFQAYRNYDGQGHAFGDTSVSATSSDVARASIYASIDANDPSRMVLIAINRSDKALTASLDITHDTKYASVTPYVVSQGHPEPVKADAISAIAPNSFELSLPAYSVSVLLPSE